MIKNLILTLGVAFAVGVACARESFNPNTDILIAQFDCRPDADDIHSQAAFGCMMAHPDLADVNIYAVMGAVGKQGGTFIDATELFKLIYGDEGPDTWTDAWDNWNLSVTRITNKVRPILDAGGHVWVQEAGQSDITRDWIQTLINEGVSLAAIKSRITVVQHSNWNESKASDGVLADVKDWTDYVKIADGNVVSNGTPGYNLYDTTYMNEIFAGDADAWAEAVWLLADNIIVDSGFSETWSPIDDGGVDFSDCVENWWIFEIGNDADTVRKFWNRYVIDGSDTENSAPTVSFDLPATDLFGVPVGSSIFVEAKPADEDGLIAKVDLYLNGVFVRSEEIPPYTWGDAVLTDLDEGTYLLELVATDNKGAESEVATRTIVVDDGVNNDTITLNPAADAYVRNGKYADSNYGSATTLEIKEAGVSWTRRTYLRYDLSSVTDLSQAVLRLKLLSASGSDTHTAYFVSDDSWEESALTWNNMPAGGIALDSAVIPTAAGDWLELDVTPQIASELAGDKTFSVVIISDDSNLGSYYSREAVSESDRPQLVISGNVDPDWTELTFDNFDEGLVNWIDGGSDVELSTAFALGAQCLRLRDNSGSSYTELSDALDLSSASELKVELSFVAQSHETGDGFEVKYSSDGGASWTTIQSFLNDIDYLDNGTRYNLELLINSADYSFSDSVIIRIESFANQDLDYVYVDDVRISAK